MNNESVGISTEVALAKFFNLDMNEDYVKRADSTIVSQLFPVLKYISKDFSFRNLTLKEFSGECGALHDFMFVDGKSLSVKTNLRGLAKVCPQHIGQTTSGKFLTIFKPNLIQPEDKEERYKIIKKLVWDNIDKFLVDYYKELFSSDYLLYVYNFNQEVPKYFLLDIPQNLSFNMSDISFSKSLEEWIEGKSIRVSYKNKVIGEFQNHSNRDSFKFRFYIKNLLSILDFEEKNVKIESKDYLDFIRDIPSNSINLILADPKYLHSEDFGKVDFELKRNKLKQLLTEWKRILKPNGRMVSFCDIWNLGDFKKFLEKEDFQEIDLGIPSKEETFITASLGNSYINTNIDTSKPLYERIISKYTNPNDIVLDCFSGTGITALTCLKTNRKFLGCEQDPKLYSISVEKINQTIKGDSFIA